MSAPQKHPTGSNHVSVNTPDRPTPRHILQLGSVETPCISNHDRARPINVRMNPVLHTGDYLWSTALQHCTNAEEKHRKSGSLRPFFPTVWPGRQSRKRVQTTEPSMESCTTSRRPETLDERSVVRKRRILSPNPGCVGRFWCVTAFRSGPSLRATTIPSIQ